MRSGAKRPELLAPISSNDDHPVLIFIIVGAPLLSRNPQWPGDRPTVRINHALSGGCEGVFGSGAIGDQIALMTLAANARRSPVGWPP